MKPSWRHVWRKTNTLRAEWRVEGGGGRGGAEKHPQSHRCVPDLQDAVQGSLVQRSASLVHQSRPDDVHRVGRQSSRQAANKTGPGEGEKQPTSSAAGPTSTEKQVSNNFHKMKSTSCL